MEDQLDELENTVSRMALDVMEITYGIETLKQEVQELRDEVSIDNLVECIHWILGRLKTIEKKLVIIPPALGTQQATE